MDMDSNVNDLFWRQTYPRTVTSSIIVNPCWFTVGAGGGECVEEEWTIVEGPSIHQYKADFWVKDVSLKVIPIAI